MYEEYVEEANEVPAFIINGIPILAGPDQPAVALVNAVEGSLFVRGGPGIVPSIFSKQGPLPHEWIGGPVINLSTAGSNSNCLEFCRADGSPDNIPLINGELPFFRANGSQDDIPTVAC